MMTRSFNGAMLISAAAFLLFAHTAEAQADSLALSSGVAAANGTVSLNLSVTSLAGNEPAGVQWTFTYPAASVTSISATIGAASTAASKILSCSAATGSYTCIVSGMNTTIISNGVVAVLNLTMAAGATTTQIGVANMVLSSVS